MKTGPFAGTCPSISPKVIACPPAPPPHSSQGPIPIPPHTGVAHYKGPLRAWKLT